MQLTGSGFCSFSAYKFDTMAGDDDTMATDDTGVVAQAPAPAAAATANLTPSITSTTSRQL